MYMTKEEAVKYKAALNNKSVQSILAENLGPAALEYALAKAGISIPALGVVLLTMATVNALEDAYQMQFLHLSMKDLL